MERLIEENEKKFRYYWSAEGEKELDLTEYLPNDDKGGAFSLSALTEMDGQLLRDKSFNEMFNDVRRYCSKDFVENAKHVERYYVLVAGLLRQLLRACASTFDPQERKVLLEMVYRWYRDKRKKLLQERLKKTRKLKKPVLRKVLREGEHVPEQELESEVKEPEQEVDEMESNKQVIEVSHSRNLPLFVNKEKKKALFISNKLKQYRCRDLHSSHAFRRQQKENLSNQSPVQPSTPKTAFEQAKETERQKSWGRQQINHAQINQAQINDRPQTTPAERLTQTLPDRNKLYSQPRLLSYQKPKSFTEMKIYKHWLRHRARDAQEQMEDMNFRGAVDTWAFNRARIEEEILRRQESKRYSSQTGVTLHKIVSKDQKESERQAQATKRLLEQLNENMDSFLDSDSDFSDSDVEEHEKPTSAKDSGDDAIEEDLSDKLSSNKVPSEPEIPIFLSPYNSTNLDKVPHPLSKPDSHLPLNNFMEEDEKALASKGFIPPTHFSTSTIPKTPIIGYHRSKTAPTTLVGTLNTSEQPDQRPATSSSLFQRLKTQSDPIFLDENDHIYNKSPNLVHFHSIYDRDGFVEKPKKKRKKKKSKSPAPSKKSAGKGKKGAKGKKEEKPADQPPVEEPPVEPRPPSLLRTAQLDECDRIKLSLAKSGWKVPASVIQRSILIPEDESYEDCVKVLPSKGYMHFQCIIPEEKKAKKKKGKKKKGKKKKKKK